MVALAAGLLLVGASVLITQAALNNARRTLVDRLEQSTADLREMLSEQVKVDVEALFARFLEILNPASEVAAEHEVQMRAQHQRIEEMIRSFEALETEVSQAR